LLTGEGNIHFGNLTDAKMNSSGVEMVARKEGSQQNWGDPPDPEKKDLGAR